MGNVIKFPQSVHSLVGGMTTDYFEFFCESCGVRIDHIEQKTEHPLVSWYEAKCPQCNTAYSFKMNIWTARMKKASADQGASDRGTSPIRRGTA